MLRDAEVVERSTDDDRVGGEQLVGERGRAAARRRSHGDDLPARRAGAGRARRVELTPEGTARLCGLERALRAAEDELLDPLDPDERATLRSLLHRLATHDGAERVSACEVARSLGVELT